MEEAEGDGVETSTNILKTGEWTTTNEGDDSWKSLEFADKYVGSSRS